ncbi:MAG: hypothetical protein ACP5OE_09645 [Thermodesulfobium sp.]
MKVNLEKFDRKCSTFVVETKMDTFVFHGISGWTVTVKLRNQFSAAFFAESEVNMAAEDGYGVLHRNVRQRALEMLRDVGYLGNEREKKVNIVYNGKTREYVLSSDSACEVETESYWIRTCKEILDLAPPEDE